MTIAVTGAAGHIGANLVRALLAAGQPVRALVHRDRRALDGLDIELAKGGLSDPESLCRAFEGAEVVYHLASRISLLMTDWPRLEAVNVTGTRNVVEACLRCGVGRLVYFSSIEALSPDPLDAPVDELRPPVDQRHASPYARSKAAAGREVGKGIERGLDAITIHPTAVIGPHDYKPSHIGEVLVALARRRLPALVEGGFNWVDARDVAEGAMRVAGRAQPGARYILSGHWVSVRDLAASVRAITGVRPPGLAAPMWLARVGAPFLSAYAHLTWARPLYTAVSLQALRGYHHVSHDRATRELDYHPRPFQETLSDTLRWFEAAGQITLP